MKVKSIVPVFAVAILLATSLAAFLPNENVNVYEEGRGLEGLLGAPVTPTEGFINPVTHRTDYDSSWTKITNVQQLSNMRNNLSGKYYLANDIDFSTDTSGYSNGGIMIPLKVEVKTNTVEVTIGASSGALSRTYVWLGPERVANPTAGSPCLISYTPSDVAQVLTIEGYYTPSGGSGAYFAYTMAIEPSASGVQFNGTFDSNGNFEPIAPSISNPFSGIFDGNGYVIRGMNTTTCSGASSYYSGMFGVVGSNGEIKNVGIENGSHISTDYSTGMAGAVTAYLIGSASITNCYNTSIVSATSSYVITSTSSTTTARANSYAGGIAGETDNTASITNCSNAGIVSSVSLASTASSSSASFAYTRAWAGGITGYAAVSSSITNSCNTGTITASPSTTSAQSLTYGYAGGIVGDAEDSVTITGCCNTGRVSSIVKSTSASAFFVNAEASGIANGRAASITDSCNTGNIAAWTESNSPGGPYSYWTEASSYSGGAKAYGIGNASVITDCYNTGNVTAETAWRGFTFACGIGGLEWSTITDCYNTGNVTASTEHGANARAYGIGEASSVTGCYNTGDITASSDTSLFVKRPRDSTKIYSDAAGIGQASTIINCYNTGNIEATSREKTFASGIGSALTITDCCNTGDITAISTPQEILEIYWNESYAGGIAGQIMGVSATVTNCYNVGAVTAVTDDRSSAYAAGVVACKEYPSNNPTGNQVSIEKCYNTGVIMTVNTGSNMTLYGTAAGILGRAYGDVIIDDCYNTGDIIGVNGTAAGILNRVTGTDTTDAQLVSITNCYNTGYIEATDTTQAGIAGNINAVSTVITNCYYLTGCLYEIDISSYYYLPDVLIYNYTGTLSMNDGSASPAIKTSGPDQRSSAKTAVEMRPSFSNAAGNNSIYYTGTTTKSGTAIPGWNFSSVWNIDPAVNGGYPTLRTSVAIPLPPSVTTRSLTDGLIGAGYSETLYADGDTPITWSVDSGDLPGGLTLSSGGIISGTPTAAGTFDFIVKAVNANGSATRALSITIAALPAPSITTSSLAGGTAGTYYEGLLTATGDSITWSIVSGSGELPGGLSLSSAGLIYGTPTGSGTFNFTVKATNTGGEDTKALSIIIGDAPTYSISFADGNNKDFGSAVHGYDAQTPYPVTVNNTGNQETGMLTVSLSAGDTGCFSLDTLSLGNILIGESGGFTVRPDTGLNEGTYWATVTVSGTNVTSISFDVTFEVTGTVAVPLSITTSSLADGMTGAYYEQSLTATGDGTISWSIYSGDLPDGLWLSGSMIYGTPTEDGTYHFTVKAASEYGEDTRSLSITVGDAPPYSISGSVSFSDLVGMSGNYVFNMTGDVTSTTKLTIVSGVDVLINMNGYDLKFDVAYGDAIEVKGTGRLTITGGGIVSLSDTVSGNTVRAYDNAVVNIAADITAAFGVYFYWSCGIHASDDAVVTVTGDITVGNYGRGIDVSIDAVVTVTGDITVGDGGSEHPSYGIYASDNTVVTLTGDITAGNYSRGIYASDDAAVTVDGDITVGNGIYVSYSYGSYYYYSYGISASGDSTVTVTGDITAGNYSYGISASGDSTVTVTGDITVGDGIYVSYSYGSYYYYSYGISASGDSTVTVTGDITAGNYSRGIYASGDSTVTVTGDITVGDSYGIYASDNAVVTLTGDITVDCLYYYDGIYTSDNAVVTLTGDITVSYGRGISASGDSTVTVIGNITADGGSGISASGDAAVTVTGDITFSNGYYSSGIYASGDAVVTVTGDITVTGVNSHGVEAWGDAAVTVTGNITVIGDDNDGIYFAEGAQITVDGELNVSGTGSGYVVLLYWDPVEYEYVKVLFPPNGPVESETKIGFMEYADENSDAILWMRYVHPVELDPDTNKDFGSVSVGYGEQTVHTVTVTNKSNISIGTLTIALSGSNSGSFHLSKTTMSIGPDDNDTFTVRPITGLSVGLHTATVTVSGENGILKSFNVTFEVTDTAVPPSITTYSLAGGMMGTHYEQSLTAIGDGTITWSVYSGDLPDGLWLIAGVIYGTPTAAGTFYFTVKAASEFGEDTRSLSITIGDALTYSISFADGSNKDFGSAVQGYDAQTPYPVTVNNTGNQETGMLTVSLSAGDTGCFSLDTLSLGNILIGESGGFTVRPDTGLNEGTYWATVTVSGSNVTAISFNVTFEVTAPAVPPSIATSSLAGGVTGAYYQQTLDATGDGTITWSVYSGSLPDGLGLSGGVICGTPTVTGTFYFTVKATSEYGEDTRELSIVITGSTYSIMFESNGGSDVSPITQEEGTSVSQPADPSWGGHIFIGWYSDEGLTEPYVFDTMPSEDVTLWAKWADIPDYFSYDGLVYTPTGDREVSVTGWDTIPGDGNLVIPGSVTYDGITYSVVLIEPYAFQNCIDLKTVDLSSVPFVRVYAFLGCTALEYVIIGPTTVIESHAFFSCTGLLGIYVDAGNPDYMSVDGVLFNKAGTMLIQYPVGRTQTHYTIPDSVTTIWMVAFWGCTALESVTIPGSVTSVGDGAFSGCSALTSVSIPSSVTSVGDFVFDSCYELAVISIPYSLESTMPSNAVPYATMIVWYEGAASVTATKGDGETIELSVVPNTGKEFSGITVGTTYGDSDVAMTGMTFTATGKTYYAAVSSTAIYYAVAYNITEGGGTVPVESVKAYEDVFYAAYADGLTAPGIMQFKEWNTAADGSGTGYAEGAIVTMPADNLTLYAIWELPKYTVTYIIVNGTWGGTLTEVTETVTHGGTFANIPENMTPSAAYTQDPGSWDTEPTTSTTVNSDMVFTYTYSTRNVYTVTYTIVNGTWGGSLTEMTETVVHGDALANIPTGIPDEAYTQDTGSWIDLVPTIYTEVHYGNMVFTYVYSTKNTYTVTYNILNGTWDGTLTEMTETVTHGDALANIPTGIPDEAYTQNPGSWGTEPTSSTVVTHSGMVFTYVYGTMNTYEVTLTEGTGYVIYKHSSMSDPVLHGEWFSFVLALDPAYSKSDLKVRVNDTVFDMIDGDVFKITNITEAITVRVEGVVRNVHEFKETPPTSWVKGSADGFVMIVDTDSHLDRLLVGTYELTVWEHYMTAPGSTIITIFESYLKSLPAGPYDIVAEFIDGTASTILSISEPSSTGGEEGGNEGGMDMMIIIAVVAVIAIVGIGAAFFLMKKK